MANYLGAWLWPELQNVFISSLSREKECCHEHRGNVRNHLCIFLEKNIAHREMRVLSLSSHLRNQTRGVQWSLGTLASDSSSLFVSASRPFGFPRWICLNSPTQAPAPAAPTAPLSTEEREVPAAATQGLCADSEAQRHCLCPRAQVQSC